MQYDPEPLGLGIFPLGIEKLGRLERRHVGTQLVHGLHPLIILIRVKHDTTTCKGDHKSEQTYQKGGQNKKGVAQEDMMENK
jgi:hypothetical protein